MRSSKSRSRSKTNRPRTLGNIINRVFDSSGPEGKVRGTPQQIIEKYQMLARDAQLSNDRVAAENFLQHAEHYTRLLAEANRELAAEQELRQQFQSQNQGQPGQGQAGQGQPNQSQPNMGQPGQNRISERQNGDRDSRHDYRSDSADIDAPYVSNASGFNVVGEDDSAIVELPEMVRQQPRRDEYRREDRPQGERPQQDRPQSDRPQGENRRREDNRRRDERPRDERPRDDRPRDVKPREDRPREERARDDSPREDKPHDNKPNAPRPRQNPVVAEETKLPRFISEPMFDPAPVNAPSVPLPVKVEIITAAPTMAQAAEPTVQEKPAKAPRVRKPVVKPSVAEDPKAAE